MSYIKDIINEKRKECKHTVKYLHEQIGISYDSLQKYFSVESIGTIKTTEKLMKFYNLKIVQDFDIVINDKDKQKEFIELMTNPPEPNEALKEAKKNWEKLSKMKI
jgi:predicted transcriptional regulator